MKKTILFVIDSLHCAGAEKSLTTLLNLLDYSKYEIDLQLFGYGGVFEKLLPKDVNLLKPLEYINFNNKTIKESIISSIKNKNYKMLSARLKFSGRIHIAKYNNAEKARIFWKYSEKVIPISGKKYDIAIAYAQALPTFFVSEKIKADKKYAWVNVSYSIDKRERDFQTRYYSEYNKIIAVSDETKDIFADTFPEHKEKLEVIRDIMDPNFIEEMSKNGESYKDKFEGIRILTIGRLAEQKGYNVALEACKLLKEKGINFRWYVLGKGPLEEEIRHYIKDNKLEKNFILLGVSSNPYPYIRDCDIYVQTSKFEGFGIAIAEARMLNKPVVTTKFDAVFAQMIHRKNGLVVENDSKSVCNGILELINNCKLKEEIINFLKQEKKGNLEELDKFKNLILI